MPRERRMISRSGFMSKKLMKCDDSHFLLFVGLILEADDEGRGEGEPEALKLKFPNRKWQEKKIEAMMGQLSKVGLVEWYTNDGGLYYEIVNFMDFQQGSWHGRSAKKSRIPSPYVSTEVVHQERLPGPPTTVTPSTNSGSKGREVKGREVKGREVNPFGAYTKDFLKAKEEYPKRKGNQAYPEAFERWKKLISNNSLNEAMLICACRNYRLEQESIDKAGTEYVMQMTKFLGPGKHFVTYMAEDFEVETEPTPRDPEEEKEYVRQFREGERDGTLILDKEKRQVTEVATGKKWMGPRRSDQQQTDAPERSTGEGPPY